MHTVKRIEIVIDKPHLPHVRRALDDVGVPGLTVLEAIAGYGDRGDRDVSELTDSLSNLYLLTTCAPDQIDQLAQSLEPILRRYGGLCLISDAQMIRDEA